jgi:hypothetical protein
MAKRKPQPESISIEIDPAIVAEMQAEAQKTPEQRQADKDELFALMGNMMMEYGKGMLPTPKPKKPSPPTKQADENFDYDALEI